MTTFAVPAWGPNQTTDNFQQKVLFKNTGNLPTNKGKKKKGKKTEIKTGRIEKSQSKKQLKKLKNNIQNTTNTKFVKQSEWKKSKRANNKPNPNKNSETSQKSPKARVEKFQSKKHLKKLKGNIQSNTNKFVKKTEWKKSKPANNKQYSNKNETIEGSNKKHLSNNIQSTKGTKFAKKTEWLKSKRAKKKANTNESEQSETIESSPKTKKRKKQSDKFSSANGKQESIDDNEPNIKKQKVITHQTLFVETKKKFRTKTNESNDKTTKSKKRRLRKNQTDGQESETKLQNKKNDSNSELKFQTREQKYKAILKVTVQQSKQTNLSKKQTAALPLRERMLDKLKGARFRFLNEQMYTSIGRDAKRFFESDPDAYHAYHEGYKQQVARWPLNPLDVIIEKIKKLSRTHIIADFGCGEAKLAQSVSQKVHSFDLVAINDSVTACDMAHVPLENTSVNVVVFCLSLMGTNLKDYLLEANRVLMTGGLLKIAEVESRFDNIDDFIKDVKSFGFKMIAKDLSHDLFCFLDFVKKEANFKQKKKLPNVSLNPCLYKKR